MPVASVVICQPAAWCQLFSVSVQYQQQQPESLLILCTASHDYFPTEISACFAVLLDCFSSMHNHMGESIHNAVLGASDRESIWLHDHKRNPQQALMFAVSKPCSYITAAFRNDFRLHDSGSAAVLLALFSIAGWPSASVTPWRPFVTPTSATFTPASAPVLPSTSVPTSVALRGSLTPSPGCPASVPAPACTVECQIIIMTVVLSNSIIRYFLPAITYVWLKPSCFQKQNRNTSDKLG